jgi:adenine-specific DNA-methyltransferase
MAEIHSETVKGTTLDIAAENRARLKQLFPTVFTETRNEKGELCESIDFEKLKAELGTFSDTFESRRERYGMEWPGKKEALHLIQTLSSATLKPCRQESVNFDTTKNLFIEGDNLEVLKLLQTSYYGKVKMIYIDPPYNTGKEFIYPDNFSESLETYLEYAGHEGRWKDSQSANAQENPRYHTRWMNMMYPRLYLARNLLRDDGVIFISIDDNEVSNLRKLCDEIFGEENFVAVFPWKKRTTKSDVPFGVSQDYEWVIAFTKGELQAGVSYERKYYQTSDFPNDRWRLSDLTTQRSAEERPNSAFIMVDQKNR